MTNFDFDLFVIGAGSGGVRAARIAATYGAKVAIAEEYRVGGTCVIRGCVPKKLLVYASRFADDFEDAAGYGWHLDSKPVFDWPTLIANKDREIDRLEAAYVTNLERSGARIVRSRAVLEDAHRVRLVATGEVVRAKYILIATGGWPYPGADIAGIEHVISSNEAFHLKQMPKRILIQGGGYIAVEFAGIFRGLGSEVTLVYRGDNILRGFDDDVREHLRNEMTKRGINIVTRKTVEGIEKVDRGLCVQLSDHESVLVDQVMFATGRRPNIAGLGLEKVGVALNEKGAIKVDRYSQTSVPSIYAVGDVTDRVALTPVAIREGHAFSDTVFDGKTIAVDHSDIPTAVFSEPEVGVIGLTEAEARSRFDRVDIYKTSFRPMKATLAARDTRSFFKLIVDGTTDRVLGCHIVGPDAGELIQVVGIAIKMRATKAD
ncbi:glutathione-disulfide reductase, partial [Hyphomicrobium sp.]|uniref:glutathione-disulfide reductase n=1 Tax=Hyphomicrobium sp. TaxID=82 RepID=UPI002D79F7E1